MKNFNTPPRNQNILDEEETSEMNIDDLEDPEEVYEIENEEDLEALEEQLMCEQNEIEDDDEGTVQTASLVYAKHQDSVFCAAFSPSNKLVATGGEDDRAYLWCADTGETKLECTDYEDSVTCVSFSHDGKFLAVGDMKGHITAWNTQSFEKSFEFETSEDLNFLLWHKSSNILFCGTNGGSVYMWLIPQGHTKSLCNAAVSAECGVLMNDGLRLCVGFMDGSIKVLELKTCKTLHTLQCHEGQVTSIAAHQDNALLISGGIDGIAVLSNSRSGMEIAKLSCAVDGAPSSDKIDDDGEDEFNNTVEVVSYCPANPNLAITATLSGVITIWDINSKTSRHHIVQGCGTSQITWHPTQPLFFSAGIDGNLRLFDARSGEQKVKFVGHTDSILGCDVSSDCTKIVTCADDSTARIFSIDEIVS